MDRGERWRRDESFLYITFREKLSCRLNDNRNEPVQQHYAGYGAYAPGPSANGSWRRVTLLRSAEACGEANVSVKLVVSSNARKITVDTIFMSFI